MYEESFVLHFDVLARSHSLAATSDAWYPNLDFAQTFLKRFTKTTESGNQQGLSLYRSWKGNNQPIGEKVSYYAYFRISREHIQSKNTKRALMTIPRYSFLTDSGRKMGIQWFFKAHPKENEVMSYVTPENAEPGSADANRIKSRLKRWV